MAQDVGTQQDEVLTEEQLQQDAHDEEAGFAESFGQKSPAAAEGDDDQGGEQLNADESEAGDLVEGEVVEQGDQLEAGQEQETETEDQARERLAALLDSLPKLNERGDLNEQQIRQLNGKIGEINRTIKSLQQQGQPVKIEKESFKRLSAEFPEIAEILAEDLSGLSLGGSQQVDVEGIVQQRLTEATDSISLTTDQKIEARVLSIAHRDWKTVVQSDEFKKWATTLPQEEQQTLAQSWDADYLSDKLTEFKTQRKAKETQSQQRNKRLANAILPKVNSAPRKGLTTEQDGFDSVFR